jgi:DNA (cytosine-5)-methyltransferase 1
MAEHHLTPQTRYRLVDLFAGCGGISRGFQWTGRFGTDFAIEHEKHPAHAFARNIKNSIGSPTHVYAGDITDLSESRAALWREFNKANIVRPGQIDVLVGGPPCQGFSRNGVRKYVGEGKKERFYDDPRNHLYKAFLDILAELHPPLVLIENVREFLNFGGGKFSSDLLSKLDELGYYADYRKLCAADFGVPQVRHRVFFVAIDKQAADLIHAVPTFPHPCFMDGTAMLPGFGMPRYRTVRDAIADLPEPVHSHKESPQPYDTRALASSFGHQIRSSSGVVHNHVARRLSQTMLDRIRAVGTGRMKHIDPSLRTESFYGGAYGRLAWDEPSLTITTWVYHVGSGRYAHPEQDRAITMREAARLQSFDDDFVFPPLINPVSQMIGNAVPPLLANAFALQFLDILDRIALAQHQLKEAVVVR